MTTSTTAAAALTFSGVSKTFGDGTAALDRVSLDVGSGELVSVVGPSGCGKTTLLRVAAGLEPATSGEVGVDRPHLGYVFQDATLLPWRTVARNVALFAELDGMPKDLRRQRVAEAIELVGLGGVEDKYPRQLSGGMRMRVSLARALLMEPATFLFDEPFGALDEITRQRLNGELLALFGERRFAALFVTHSVYEAVYLSTRVVVMSGPPGSVADTFEVPFAYPRAPQLRFDAAFAALAGEVSAALRAAAP